MARSRCCSTIRNLFVKGGYDASKDKPKKIDGAGAGGKFLKTA